MSGVLYVVATPIGNLDDLTHRAVKTLESVELVAAEDTRRTRTLLAHCNVRAPRMLSLREHNETQQSATVVQTLRAGFDVALVSDAGTPLISDPGMQLLAAVWQAQLRVVPIPGASAVMAALCACPFPVQGFQFHGFLPHKGGQRSQRLRTLLQHEGSVVLFEAPHRVLKLIGELKQLATQRRVFVGRELTKLHETLYLGLPHELEAVLHDEHRGEFVVIVEGARISQGFDLEADRVLSLLLPELPPRTAAKIVAQLCNVPVKDAYRQAVALRGADSDKADG